ncbi:hypothetical protein HJC99_04150 [Candidatus Saccharibacteria bacterium]|nr:hypothetical protein [Candidatus Saccharibacteria bacterium]
MNQRRYLILAALLITLVPAATSADARLAAVDRCTLAVNTADTARLSLKALQDQQLTAISRIHTRLSNLVIQASLQGHSLKSISADDTELTKRQTEIVSSYTTLLAAVSATGSQCGLPSAMATAKTDLTATRTQVASFQLWAAQHLTPDLQLAVAKS